MFSDTKEMQNEQAELKMNLNFADLFYKLKRGNTKITNFIAFDKVNIYETKLQRKQFR